MRTQIRFKDGRVETYEDSAPSIDTQEKDLTLVDESMGVIEHIPIKEIAKVIFIP